MSGLALKIYHHLPPPLRDAAASLRGARLRAWRYGPETDTLTREALERDRWTEEQWDVWRSRRLYALLERAATRVPWYRDYWAEHPGTGAQPAWANLADWPILEKEALRENPDAFLVEGADPVQLMVEHTSGTTGKSLHLSISRGTSRAWYALMEARWRRWYGVSMDDRWALLGGQLVTPVARTHPPFWVWNSAMRQLYMSSYHLAPGMSEHYLDALVRYRIRYLWGYTSALCALAQEAVRQQRQDLHMAVVITNAEPVFDYQRKVMEEAFHCPVRATYGMSEMVAAASECEHGALHLWPDAGVVEFLDEGRPVSAGQSGDLICTGLLNEDMPLIRYRVGDRGVLQSTDAPPCACGRTLPVLAAIEGRCDDLLFTPDGRRVGRLDPVFKANLPVREAQIIQERIDALRVLVVPAPGYTEDDGRSIAQLLRERMGRIEVAVEIVTDIPRGANGKFRAVVCRIPQGERPT